jgi:hypothetical protein
MKSPKSRIKLLRVACGNCNSTQDSVVYACTNCGKRMYSNVEETEIADIVAHVEEQEALLTAMETPLSKKDAKDPKKNNPYAGMDRAFVVYRALRKYSYMPGMKDYLDRVLEVLIPLRITVLERTVKANKVFALVLVAFPIVALILGMHWMVAVFLFLPAVAWVFITIKATKDLQKARDHLQKIQGA